MRYKSSAQQLVKTFTSSEGKRVFVWDETYGIPLEKGVFAMGVQSALGCSINVDEPYEAGIAQIVKYFHIGRKKLSRFDRNCQKGIRFLS